MSKSTLPSRRSGVPASLAGLALALSAVAPMPAALQALSLSGVSVAAENPCAPSNPCAPAPHPAAKPVTPAAKHLVHAPAGKAPGKASVKTPGKTVEKATAKPSKAAENPCAPSK